MSNAIQGEADDGSDLRTKKEDVVSGSLGKIGVRDGAKEMILVGLVSGM